MKFPLLAVGIALLAALPFPTRAQGPAITIVTGSDTTDLEKYAATELAGLLKTLFQAEITLVAGPPPAGAKNPILLGSAADLGEQAHVVKSTPAGLAIRGGSPVATLWAVYEYGYANGMRYLTSGDFSPVEKPAFTLDGYDIAMKPAQEIRAWRPLGESAASQASWSLADHGKLLRQLAKMKFNRVILPDPDRKPIPGIDVTGDIAGRSVFGGAKVFENSDGAAQLAEGIADDAKRLGMTTGTTADTLPVIPLGQAKGGLLPQIERLTPPPGGKGFAVQTHFVGDHNPELHYLSRAAFDPKLTPEKALVDLARPICGEGVTEALSLGFTAVADASAVIEKNDPTFAVPDTKMFMEHYESADPAPAWWAEAKTLYTKGMNEMYRANRRASEGARPWILYHAKRHTFAVHYLTAVESVKKAGLARAAKDDDARVENLELAVEAMHNALGIYSEVAADQSDRGAIALLNEYAYRPLLKALNE